MTLGSLLICELRVFESGMGGKDLEAGSWIGRIRGGLPQAQQGSWWCDEPMHADLRVAPVRNKKN